MGTPIKTAAVFAALGLTALASVLFIPPARDKFFTTRLWPWPLPWDTNKDELDLIKSLSKPGDVIVESNLHGWQWVALCLATTKTAWVHAAIVDESKNLLTVEKEVIATGFDIYERWGSTRLCLIRPPYEDVHQVGRALSFAREALGTKYDASFTEETGNCNGLVASSLKQAGLQVHRRNCFGKSIYAPDCFFAMEGAEIIWLSDRDRTRGGSRGRQERR